MRAVPQRATAWIVTTLRWGSILSAALMLAGVLWLLQETDRPMQVGPPMPLPFLVGQLRGGNPYAIMQTGLLLLLLTPLLRLGAAALSFWMGRERRYALVSLTVLAVILVSVFLWRGG